MPVLQVCLGEWDGDATDDTFNESLQKIQFKIFKFILNNLILFLDHPTLQWMQMTVYQQSPSRILWLTHWR